MTLFIAFLLINGLDWHWLWNLVALIVWFGHLTWHDDLEAIAKRVKKELEK